MTSGTYILRVGEAFYIGSSWDFRKRRYAHSGDLKKGIHPNKKLQAAFAVVGTCDFVPFRFIPREADDSDESFRDRLRAAEQSLLNDHRADPNLCNKIRNAAGPDNGVLLASRWQDPAFRAYMTKVLSGRKASPETKERMSLAKRGANNHGAKAAILCAPDGTRQEFATASDLAKFIGVQQQILHLWINGLCAWPGTGRRAPQTRYAHLVGFSAAYKSLA